MQADPHFFQTEQNQTQSELNLSFFSKNRTEIKKIYSAHSYKNKLLC